MRPAQLFAGRASGHGKHQVSLRLFQQHDRSSFHLEHLDGLGHNRLEHGLQVERGTGRVGDLIDQLQLPRAPLRFGKELRIAQPQGDLLAGRGQKVNRGIVKAVVLTAGKDQAPHRMASSAQGQRHPALNAFGFGDGGNLAGLLMLEFAVNLGLFQAQVLHEFGRAGLGQHGFRKAVPRGDTELLVFQ